MQSPHDLLERAFSSPLREFPAIESSEFIVYGAGNYGRMIGALIEKSGGKILYFIDKEKKPSFPWPVIHLHEFQPGNSQAYFVLGIFNAYVDTVSLLKELSAAGIKDIFTPVETFQWLHASSPASQYWLATRDQYLSQREMVLATMELLADDTSKNLYSQLWEYRLTGDIRVLPEPSPVEVQYFPDDIPSWKSPLRIIDCGAFTGDTLRYIRNHKIQIDAVAAFEPDPANYAKLVEYMSGWIFLDQCTLLPCGAYDSAAQLRFSSDAGAGSAINESGNITIQCASIDQSLPCFRPNLIKMDIEGAEREALLGAEKTIRENRPGLAISLYHTPDHLWSIPRLIANWGLGYRFYIRTHLYQEFETVLYAIPN